MEIVGESANQSTDSIEKRKKKIKNWLKDKDNLALVGVLVLAFILRLYYFILTKNQPLWWDETAYGTLAKNSISHIWDGTEIIKGETLIRPPFFPFLWSILIKAGFSEVAIRFLLEFIPSILSVLFLYLTVKELYNKKVGLFSTFIFSVLWIHLFYTGRLLTHAPSLAFLFASTFLFIKSIQQNINYKYFIASLTLASFVTLMRYPDGLIFGVYAIFLLIVKKTSIMKDPMAWIAAVIGFIPILVFFLYNYITKGNIFPALLGSDYVQSVSKSFAFNILNFINVYLTDTFLIFFIFGMGLVLFELFISYGFISKNKKLQSHLFTFLMILIFYSFYIFYIKGAEDRWLFPLSLSFTIFVGLGLNYAYNFIKKYNKLLSVILIIGVLSFGAYSELKVADFLIKEKKETYLQLKQGFEWLRDNSPADSTMLIAGMEVYGTYYGERKYLTIPQNESDLDKINADYLIAHSFSQQPSYINEYLQNNQDKWSPVNAFFFDKEQKQAALIIYQRIKNTE